VQSYAHEARNRGTHGHLSRPVKGMASSCLAAAHRYNDKEIASSSASPDLPRKNARKRPYLQKKQLTTIAANEVQYET